MSQIWKRIPNRISGYLTSMFLTMLIFDLGFFSSGNAANSGNQSMSVQLRPISPVYKWPSSLPSQSTMVDIVSDYGRFRMPIGYFSDPYLLARQTDGVGPIGLRQFKVQEVTFRFEMPNGLITNNQSYQFEPFRADGSKDPDLDKYVVWFISMSRPNYSYTPQNVLTLDLPILDSTLSPPIDNEIVNYKIYQGKTTAPLSSDEIGIIWRRSLASSDGSMFFKTENLSLGVVTSPKRFRDVFKIARQADRLLRDWLTN